jgi:two-component system, sporulation sensor kinase D
MDLYSKKQRWKMALVLLALAIGIGSLLYTNRLVEELAEEERGRVELWAKGTKFLANSADSDADLSFVFDVIKDNTTIPIILTDDDKNVISARNFDEDRMDDPVFLEKQLQQIAGRNEPIVIDLYGGSHNYIHYDNSVLYYRLKYYPYVSLGIISVFILLAYIAFSISRKAEQDHVWVGMAKETAHQLGTPLSSLIAWIEYLRLKEVDEEILTDMSKDVRRLETITERFSKIGSVPELEPQPIRAVIDESIGYMRSRSSKKVIFEIDDRLSGEPSVPVNVALFAWVIENLVRNAIDAMEGAGAITVLLHAEGDRIHMDLSDTGKGIAKGKFETVFQPGYTSKRRGWGLGLSLTRRIIEQYHGGKISVLRSEPGVGTTFRISLKAA